MVLIIESPLSESESLSTGGGSARGGAIGGGLTGGGGSAVSSFVSPLFPLSIKVRRGSGDDPVIRVGLLLLVFAETGVVSSVDIQANNGGFCNGYNWCAPISAEAFGCYLLVACINVGIYGNLNLASPQVPKMLVSYVYGCELVNSVVTNAGKATVSSQCFPLPLQCRSLVLNS